jgi:uncharacterized protein (DUF58 family)
MSLPPQQDNQEERLVRILKRVRRIEMLTRGMVKESLGGAYLSRFKGQGLEFDDFREYQPGDDVRFLDWNVTARMNHPFVRKYIEERELSVVLLVDVSASGEYGSGEDSKRDRAAELAAVFAFSAVQNQDKVSLLLSTDQLEHYLPARKGGSHALRCLRDILFWPVRRPGTRLEVGMDVALRRIAHRALVVVVSDFIQPVPQWERALGLLAAKHDVVALQISDPLEQELPRLGRVTLRDPETGHECLVNTSNEQVRRWYAQAQEDHEKTLATLFKRRGVEHVAVRLDRDYVPALQAFFRRRRGRRVIS